MSPDRLPPDAWLDAMERGRYQTAAEMPLLQDAVREGDPIAKALVALAHGYLDEAQGNVPAARLRFEEVRRVLAGADESWKVTALRQQAESCLEYLAMGEKLPDLPSGL